MCQTLPLHVWKGSVNENKCPQNAIFVLSNCWPSNFHDFCTEMTFIVTITYNCHRNAKKSQRKASIRHNTCPVSVLFFYCQTVLFHTKKNISNRRNIYSENKISKIFRKITKIINSFKFNWTITSYPGTQTAIIPHYT